MLQESAILPLDRNKTKTGLIAGIGLKLVNNDCEHGKKKKTPEGHMLSFSHGHRKEKSRGILRRVFFLPVFFGDFGVL